jgi:ribosome-binding ATPase YchF (GTP1/OBG family)
MKFRMIPVFLLALMLIPLTGCAKKVDPKRSIAKIQKEVVSMPVAQLESYAAAYAASIREKKTEIAKIQQEIQKMPVEKFFNNKGMTRHISEIGREAEALFERYRIYVKAFQEKGGDLSKVQIEPGQPK